MDNIWTIYGQYLDRILTIFGFYSDDKLGLSCGKIGIAIYQLSLLQNFNPT